MGRPMTPLPGALPAELDQLPSGDHAGAISVIV
jgi:hypothetical protein